MTALFAPKFKALDIAECNKVEYLMALPHYLRDLNLVPLRLAIAQSLPSPTAVPGNITLSSVRSVRFEPEFTIDRTRHSRITYAH